MAENNLKKIRERIRQQKSEERKKTIRSKRLIQPPPKGGHAATAVGQKEALRIQEKAARRNIKVTPRQAGAAVNRRFLSEWKMSQFGGWKGPKLPMRGGVPGLLFGVLEYVKQKGKEKQLKADTPEGARLRWEEAYRQGRAL